LRARVPRSPAVVGIAGDEVRTATDRQVTVRRHSMLQITRMCLIGCGLAALATPARADDDVAQVSNAPDGQYAVRRGLQGPAGMISARILLDINASNDHVGKPISIAPDLYYSATDRLQFGIVHQGPMGWQALPGVGLCVTGTDNGCPHLYDNVGFDIM